MTSKVIPIVLVFISLIVGCEKNKRISEQDLIGVWKEINSNASKTTILNGILISEMESGLYQEEIVLLDLTNEGSYSIKSDGCFIELKESKINLQSLIYTCLSSEFEQELNMTSNKMIIGNRIFKKYKN